MDWQHLTKKMAALIHVLRYLQQFMFYVLLSETQTWQRQRHNGATFVIMTTNLNWRPPGVRNMRISSVPTVTGTMPYLHQAKNTS
jgi:hypothetical protein